VSLKTLLVGGDLDRCDLVDAVEEAENLRVERVFVRTDDTEEAETVEAAGAEPLDSGRQEVAETAESLVQRVKDGDLLPDEVDPELLEQELGEEEIDAVVVAGEERLVDAALWGTAYSEYFFVDRLGRDEVREVVEEFEERTRRFGK